MKQLLLRVFITVSFCLFLTGCGNKSNALPPKPLIKFTPKLHAQYLWDQNIGNGTDGQLDLKLRPSVWQNRIYTTSFDGNISAVDAENGKLLWQENTGLKLTSPPAVSQKFVVAGTLHAKLIALDRVNGKLLWQSDLPSSLFARPTIEGNVVYVQTHDGSISAYHLKNGKQIWSQNTSTPDVMLIGNSSPLVYHDLVLAGTSTGSLWGFNKTQGTKQWDNPIALANSGSPAEQMIDITATPIMLNNTLYIATFQGSLISFDARQGRANWQKKASIFNNFAISDRALFTTDAKSDVTAYSLKTGQILWQNKSFEGRKLSAPLYDKGKIFIGDYEGYLHVLNATTGQYLDRVKIGGKGINAQPTAANGNIIVQTNDGTLGAVKP